MEHIGIILSFIYNHDYDRNVTCSETSHFFCLKIKNVKKRWHVKKSSFFCSREQNHLIHRAQRQHICKYLPKKRYGCKNYWDTLNI